MGRPSAKPLTPRWRLLLGELLRAPPRPWPGGLRPRPSVAPQDSWSASAAAFSCALTLKVSTAWAMSPISSLRPSPGSTTSKLPSANLSMAPWIWCSGPVTRRDTSSIMPIPNTTAATSSASSSPSIRSALARCAAACSFATSRATSATANSDASLSTDSRDQSAWFTSTRSPAISAFERLHPQVGIVGRQKFPLGLGDRVGEAGRQRQAGCDVLQNRPRGVELAHAGGVSEQGIGGQLLTAERICDCCSNALAAAAFCSTSAEFCWVISSICGERSVDLIDAGRLLAAGIGDLRGRSSATRVNQFHDLGERRARAIDQHDAFPNLAGAVGDQVLDILRGLR